MLKPRELLQKTHGWVPLGGLTGITRDTLMRFNCMPDQSCWSLHGPVARTVQLSDEVAGGRSGSMMVNFSGRMGGKAQEQSKHQVAAGESLTSPSLICDRSRRRIMQSDEAPLRDGSGAGQEQRAHERRPKARLRCGATRLSKAKGMMDG